MIELAAYSSLTSYCKFYCYRLSVRTLGFQPGKRGSTPRSSTILKHIDSQTQQLARKGLY